MKDRLKELIIALVQQKKNLLLTLIKQRQNFA